MTEIDQDAARLMLFAAIAGQAKPSAHLELRRLERGTRAAKRSLFIPVRATQRASDTARRCAASSDVYAGAQPRVGRDGTANSIHAGQLLLVDVDDPAAATAWQDRSPVEPSLVMETGSVTDGVAHLLIVYALREPLPAQWLPRALKRLAHHMGGDMRCTDAARIIRVPGTTNWKSEQPRPVTCTHLTASAAYTARDVVGGLLDPADARSASPARPAGPPPGDGIGRGADALFEIPASEYVPALTGRELNREGKAQCPWHAGGQERTPSLHAYPDPGRGWHCFGCNAGGSIIDFGARLYGLTPRGAGYHEVRRRLASDLLPGAIAA